MSEGGRGGAGGGLGGAAGDHVEEVGGDVGEANGGEVFGDFVDDLSVTQEHEVGVVLDVARVHAELARGTRKRVDSDHERSAVVGEAELPAAENDRRSAAIGRVERHADEQAPRACRTGANGGKDASAEAGRPYAPTSGSGLASAAWVSTRLAL